MIGQMYFHCSSVSCQLPTMNADAYFETQNTKISFLVSNSSIYLIIAFKVCGVSFSLTKNIQKDNIKKMLFIKDYKQFVDC